MKRFVLTFCMTVLLISCSSYGTWIELEKAENLLQTDPDSSWTILDGLPRASLSNSVLKARHALLYSLAADKTYRDFTNDSIARVAVEHYANHGSSYNRMRSWYSLGRVQVNGDKLQEAIVSFLQAKEDSDRLGDHHYSGMICRNLSEIYYSLFDERAADWAKESVSHFTEAGEELYIPYSEFDYVLGLCAQGKYQSADSLMSEMLGREALPDKVKSHLLLLRAHVYSDWEQNDGNKMLELYREALASPSVYPQVRDYGNLAFAHTLAGNSDSASYYLSYAYENCRSREDSVLLSYDKYRIQSFQREYSEALATYESLVANQDSIVHKKLAQSATFAAAEYFQDQAEKKKREKQTLRLTWMLIVSQLLLLVFLLYRLYRKRNEELVRAIEVASELTDNISSLKEGEGNLLSIIREQYLEQLRELRSMSSSYYFWQEDHYRMQKKLGFFQTEGEILDCFRTHLESLRCNVTQLGELEKALDLYEDGILSRIRKAYTQYGTWSNRLDDRDYLILTLLFAGFGNQQISFITGINYDLVRKRKSRYLHKIKTLGSPDAAFLAERLESVI